MNPIGPLAAPFFPNRTSPPEVPSSGSPPPSTAEKQAPIGPNPRLRLDAGLGVVVLEFVGAGDAVVRSVPNEQELRAYRLAQRTGDDRGDPLNPKPR